MALKANLGVENDDYENQIVCAGNSKIKEWTNIIWVRRRECK